MSKLIYQHLLQAVKIHVNRNGITKAASDELNKILELPHPTRELAFMYWALHADLYKKPVAVRAQRKLVHDQISA